MLCVLFAGLEYICKKTDYVYSGPFNTRSMILLNRLLNEVFPFDPIGSFYRSGEKSHSGGPLYYALHNIRTMLDKAGVIKKKKKNSHEIPNELRNEINGLAEENLLRLNCNNKEEFLIKDLVQKSYLVRKQILKTNCNIKDYISLYPCFKDFGHIMVNYSISSIFFSTILKSNIKIFFFMFNIQIYVYTNGFI